MVTLYDISNQDGSQRREHKCADLHHDIDPILGQNTRSEFRPAVSLTLVPGIRSEQGCRRGLACKTHQHNEMSAKRDHYTICLLESPWDEVCLMSMVECSDRELEFVGKLWFIPHQHP